MYGVTVADIPFFIALPVLIGFSGFFSGSETALFSLHAEERSRLLRGTGAVSRAARRLLAHPHLLLITLLLCNMVVNVLYFVISSIILLHIQEGGVSHGHEASVLVEESSHAGALVALLASLVFLMVLILFGEVVPKLVAARSRLLWVEFAAVPLLIIYEILTPVRGTLNRLLIQPLARLLSPGEPPPPLSTDELISLLRYSNEQGTIGRDERELLEDVIEMSRVPVRAIMIPRVKMPSLDADLVRRSENRAEALEQIHLIKAPIIPIVDESPDQIEGFLHTGRFILHPESATTRAWLEPTFIPELATIDQLLIHFRRHHAEVAVVVDELGQTAGLVTLDSVVEALGTDMAPNSQQCNESTTGDEIMMIGLGHWRVPASLSLHEISQHFHVDWSSTNVSTIGGLIADRLQSIPKAGDEIQLDNWRVRVMEMDGSTLISVEMEVIE